MVVTEFTYEQAKKLIDTPKVRLESDGKIVCKQKQIDCSAGLHANLRMRSFSLFGLSIEVLKN